MGSLQLRQQVWLHHIVLDKGESANFQLHGPRAYLQSIHGKFHALTHHEEKAALTCGDGAFIRDEANIMLGRRFPTARFADKIGLSSCF